MCAQTKLPKCGLRRINLWQLQSKFGNHNLPDMNCKTKYIYDAYHFYMMQNCFGMTKVYVTVYL